MNNFLIDTHCHIFKDDYLDIKKVLDNAKDNKVKYIINNGSNAKTNLEVLDSIKKYQEVYGAIGIHPEEVLNYQESDLEMLEKNLSNPKIVAIGEIGLDYHYTKETKFEQINLLEKQLKIAEKYDIPVIIHSRDATEDTINILKKFNVRGTIHSFSGSLETAKIYIKMGFLLGINGVITFKNAKIKDVIKEVGLENIILETDSPYLTPEPFRGKQNSPAHILEIGQFVANLYNTSLENVAIKTNENIRNMYKKMVIK